MFVYVVGLISPEAVTWETRESSLATLAVCTVTTPLFAWLILTQTTMPMAAATPTPIATLCHVFMLILSPFRYGPPARGTSEVIYALAAICNTTR